MTRLQKITVYTSTLVCALTISVVLYMIHPALAFIYACWILFVDRVYAYLGHAKFSHITFSTFKDIKTAFQMIRR